MICNECGKTIRKDAAFCNFCGVQVGAIIEDSNTVELLDENSNMGELDESKIRLKEKLTGAFDKMKDAFEKLKKEHGQSGDKAGQSKLMMSIAMIIVILVLVIILAIFIPKSSGSDSQYVIFEKEDELVI